MTMQRMNVSAYWIIYRQNTNIKRNFDTLYITDSTPPRKDTGVFESVGHFIGLRCHNYALCLCYIYICSDYKLLYI